MGGAIWRGSAPAAAWAIALLTFGCAAPPPVPTAVAVAPASAAAPATAKPTPGAAAPAPKPTAATAGAPPPAVAAPAGTPQALTNPGFEAPVQAGRVEPDGWFVFQHAGEPSYRYVVDAESPHGGKASLRIDNTGPEPYGAIAQVIVAKPHVGKVARLTGWLRTKDAADAGAGLTLLALQSGNTVAHNFMDETPARGTTGWTRYTITMPVPAGTDRVDVGAMLRGRGSLWLDDVVLEFVPP